MSEDCLYLNVWTAARRERKRPVMVWIHGGAWTRGGASQASASLGYDGEALARKGVVVVTVNYRLGPFGFLAHPELTAESAAAIVGQLRDRWITSPRCSGCSSNIAAFGGDPANVTIFGQSAGAWSVNTTQATPLATGSVPSGHRRERRAVRRHPDARRGRAGRHGAGQGDRRRLARSAARCSGGEALAVPSFRTSINVDGWVLPDQVRALFAQQKHSGVPVLIGSNANEWTTLGDPATFPKTLDEYRQVVETLFGDLAANSTASIQ